MPERTADTESAREVAAATIRQEHCTLGVVVSALQQWLARVAAGHAEADFGFFAAALYYISDFPERCHHPKEEDYLFAALRRRTGQFDLALDELHSEHLRDAPAIAFMEHLLVRYQGGAPGGLASFNTAVDAYAAMLGEHMRKEEELLLQASACLLPEDWREIAAVFEANDDPLLGSRAGEDFGKLYARIINSLPSKLQPAFRGDARNSGKIPG